MKKWVLLLFSTIAAIAWVTIYPKVYAYTGDPVTVAIMHGQSYAEQIQCEGKVQAAAVQTVSYGFSLRPSEIKVSVGDKVQAGQVLMNVDRTQTVAALALQGTAMETTGEESTSSANSSAASDTTVSDTTESQLQQALSDWMPQNSSSSPNATSSELESLFSQYASYAGADAAQQMKDRLLSQTSSSQTVSSDVSSTASSAASDFLASLERQVPDKITAPISGVVTAVSAEKGSFTTAAQDLFTISDTDSLDLVAQVNQNQISRVKVGQSARVSLSDSSGKSYNGTVTQIAPQAHTSTDSGMTRSVVDVTIHLAAHADSELKPNMDADTAITVQIDANMLSVPYEAVQEDNAGQEYVLTVKNGHICRQNIKTGTEFDSTVQVLSGLSENEMVVLSPASSVKAGDLASVREVRHV